MTRTFIPLLSASLLLFACSSSAPTPDPDPVTPKVVTPKVVSVPASKQYFMRTMQRTMHQAALYMPGDLTAEAQAFKPCQVTFESKQKKETKTLTYDASGRLITVKTFTLFGGAKEKEVILSAQYDAQGNTTRLQYQKGSYLSYEYDSGVLARVKVMAKADEGDKVLIEQKVLHASSGRTVVFEEVLKEGETKEAATMVYTFDDAGRAIFKVPMFQKARAQWRYYPVDAATNTQRVDSNPVEFGKLKHTHTLKNSRLVRTVTSFQAGPDSKEYLPSQTKTYTYDGDKVVSAKTVDAVVGETIETITYAYTCS